MNNKEKIENVISSIWDIYELVEEEYSPEAIIHVNRAIEELERLLKEIY